MWWWSVRIGSGRCLSGGVLWWRGVGVEPSDELCTITFKYRPTSKYILNINKRAFFV